MEKTSLYNVHLSQGARMVIIVDFLVPAWYSSVLNEYNHCKNNVFISDTGNTEEILITGEDRDRLLNQLLTVDVAEVEVNELLWGFICDEKGRIMENVSLSRLGDAFLLSVPGHRGSHLTDYMKNKFPDYSFQLENISYRTGRIALQGEGSFHIIEKVFAEDLSQSEDYQIVSAPFEGNEVLLYKISSFGIAGIELFFINDIGSHLWDKIMEAGVDYNIKPVGMMAKDILRLESGQLSFSKEMRGHVASELGLNAYINFSKENFVGKDALKKANDLKNGYQLSSIVMEKTMVPKTGAKVYDLYSNEIGFISSSGYSPSLGNAIGLAFVNVGFKDETNSVLVEYDKQYIYAQLANPPLT